MAIIIYGFSEGCQIPEVHTVICGNMMSQPMNGHGLTDRAQQETDRFGVQKLWNLQPIHPAADWFILNGKITVVISGCSEGWAERISIRLVMIYGDTDPQQTDGPG